LTYLEDRGLLTTKADVFGHRIIALPSLGWETGAARPDGEPSGLVPGVDSDATTAAMDPSPAETQSESAVEEEDLIDSEPPKANSDEEDLLERNDSES
jgi:hypothetical protein